MISHVTGTLAEKDLHGAVVDVGGLGYYVQIPLSTYDRLPKAGDRVTLKTVLHVREDAMQLFGFYTDVERRLFVLLTNTVSGIGPKLALSILSHLPVDSFVAAVVSGNLKALSAVPGIGKRSAERLVVELKDKLDDIAPAAALTGHAPEPALTKAAEDAVAGLTTLGVKPEAARKAIRQLIDELPSDQHTAPILIRRALAAVNVK